MRELHATACVTTLAVAIITAWMPLVARARSYDDHEIFASKGGRKGARGEGGARRRGPPEKIAGSQAGNQRESTNARGGII